MAKKLVTLKDMQGSFGTLTRGQVIPRDTAKSLGQQWIKDGVAKFVDADTIERLKATNPDDDSVDGDPDTLLDADDPALDDSDDQTALDEQPTGGGEDPGLEEGEDLTPPAPVAPRKAASRPAKARPSK